MNGEVEVIPVVTVHKLFRMWQHAVWWKFANVSVKSLKLEIVERQQICKELRGVSLQNTVISVATDVQIRGGGGRKLLQDENVQVKWYAFQHT